MLFFHYCSRVWRLSAICWPWLFHFFSNWPGKVLYGCTQFALGFAYDYCVVFLRFRESCLWQHTNNLCLYFQCFGYIFCYCAFMSGVSYFLTIVCSSLPYACILCYIWWKLLFILTVLGGSVFILQADAASFNLSILTSNLYGVMIGYYVHNLSINVLYAFGIALIIGWVLCWSCNNVHTDAVQGWLTFSTLVFCCPLSGIICYNLQPPVTGSENESDLSSETISNSDRNMNIKVK